MKNKNKDKQPQKKTVLKIWYTKTDKGGFKEHKKFVEVKDELQKV